MACLLASVAQAQPALDVISRNRNFAAGNYSIYPDTLSHPMTPPPAGKKPFYISHYGRHGSRYLNNRKGFDIPYKMLCSADSMGELTDVGKKVLEKMRLILDDSENRWGDLTGFGKQQHRNIASRMMERCPEVFEGSAHVDAKSTVITRCILSMGVALQVLASNNPQLHITFDASQHDMHYMNHQDRLLRKHAMTPEAKKAYDDYCSKRNHAPRLMNMLFQHPDSVRKVVDERWLNYYTIKMGLLQHNTHLSHDTYLIDLFQDDEIYRFWQSENVWWYIMHGATPLNGGHQPYTQRYLLRQLIADADSCLRLERPGVQLRYGHETVLLPLTCLLGVNGFDFQTDDLEQLEPHGWWASVVYPMASNLQFIFYRSGIDDDDVVFKLLLNEKEATLPLPADIAPYYRWNDFKDYYLKKLDDYEQLRAASGS
jgi:hypothetical protein